MSKCRILVWFCKGCKRYFEHHEQMLNCPDCGTSRQCEVRPVSGYDRCGTHRGPNPKIKYYGRTGKFAMMSRKAKKKFPLVKLASKYLEITTDPQAQTLRPLHSLLNARLMQLLNRVDVGDSSSRMEKVIQLFKRFLKWHPGLEQYYHHEEAKKARNALIDELEAMVHDYAAWNEIYKLVDEKRKLSESEMKILRDMKALISAEDAYDLVAKVLAAVTKAVNDPKILEEIRFELTRLVGDGIAGGLGEREPTPVNVRPSGMDRGQVLHSRDFERPDPEGEADNAIVSEGHDEGGIQEG